MSKRGAEEYITKEHGSTPNTDSGNTPVKMATAAQLAKRKMATPRSRLNNSRPTQPSSFSSNPFSQASETQQQPLFGGVNGAPAFGASQSFPQSNPSATSGFNFQPPSSSFTFGSTTSTTNPFASMNGATNNTAVEDTTMESPQKKPTPAFGMSFGQSNSQTNGGGFSFGQPVQQQSSNGGFQFGAVKSNDGNNNSAGALFGGISKPEEPQRSASPFGQPVSSQPSFGGFGGSATSSPSPAPSFSFGQPQSISQDNESDSTSNNQTGVNGFDANATAAPQPKPAFSFGQTQNSTSSGSAFAGFGSQKSEEPKQTPAFGQTGSSQPFSGLFGKPAVSESLQSSNSPPKSSEPVQGNPFSGLFGNASQPSKSATEESSSEAPKPSIFNFGPPQPPPTTNSTVSASSTTPAKAPLFGRTLDSSTTTSAPPFSFGTKPSEPADADGFSRGRETSRANDKSEVPNAAEPASSKALFNFAPAQTSSAGNLFSTKPSAPEAPKSQNLFGNPAESVSPTDASTQSSKPLQGFNLFGAPSSVNTSTAPSTDASKAPTWGGGSLFGNLSHPKQTSAPPAEKPSSENKPFSGFSTLPATSAASSITAPTPGKPSAQDPPQQISTDEPNPKRIVYTKSPARIPNYLNGEGYKEYDSNYRLRSLNRAFQKRIAELDPQIHDYENIIRHYVAARESIGASTGLYIRNMAGTKRKNDDGIDEERDIPPQYKRARPDEVSDFTMSNTTTASVKPTAAPTISQRIESQPPTQQKSHTPSRSTELFKSLIPGSPAKSASASQPPSQIGTDLFASMSTASTPSNLFGVSKPQEQSQPQSSAPSSGNVFTPSKTSTTPTKSPPKKSAFEMPKPATGGFASFGAAAAANAKKFERELKEKRKAEDFDSDEDDEATFEKDYEEEQRKKKAKIDNVAKTGFVPMFGGGNASVSDTPAFSFGSNSATSSNTSAASKPAFSGFGGFKPSTSSSNKPSAPGFVPAFSQPKPVETPLSPSPDPNDENSGESGDAEDEEENEDSEYQPGDEDDEDQENDEDEEEDSLPEDEVPSGDRTDDNDDDDDDDSDVRVTTENNLNKGKSLFERVEAPPPKQGGKTPVNGEKNDSHKSAAGFNFGAPIMDSAKNSTFKPGVFGSAIGKSTPETPAFSPFAPTPTSTSGVAKEPYKPATTFNFNPAPQSATSTPVEGASVLAGGTGSLTPARFEGMFGSRPSTPSNINPSNIFGQPSGTSTPGADHTWKPGSGIKFGTPEKSKDAPTFSITSPSPSREPTPFSGLFGKPAASIEAKDSSTSVGFNFGGPTSAPNRGFLGAAPHLAGGSGTTSGFSSRATSPGLTDNESVATNETDEIPSDPQTSLMDSRPGEENEEILWESRARAIKFFPATPVEKGYEPNKWNAMGTGQLRILKDKTTGKVRAILRTDPGASIVVNQYLVPSLTYDAVPQTSGSGATSFPIVEQGKIRRWAFKVKTAEMADKLSELLEREKTSGN